MTLPTAPDVDLAALAEWQAAQDRCRAEYEAHPILAGGVPKFYVGCAHCQKAKETP